MVNAETSPAPAVSSATMAEGEFRAVHRIIRDRAERYPDRPAIRDHDGSQLGYGALVRRWRGLASALRAAGAGPDQPVAVRIDRSADVIVSMLAILEAGGAYAPIDGSCPPARFTAIAGNLGARILITDEDVPPEVAALGLEVLRPGDTVERFGDDVPLAPDNLAYVLHTSGSTGVPKGVAMTHRGLARLIRWQLDDGPPGLRTLNFTPMGFDVTFQEVLSTLATGGLLCVAPEPARRDPDRLLAMLAEQKIERVFLPYVALQQLAVSARRAAEAPLSLRHVITAGERLVITDAIGELFARLPGCRLDNHYGPTEAHLVTSFTLEGDPATWDRLPAIGTAVSGADLYLLDEDLEPVPVGAEGELVVGGAAVSRGYLDAPAQTAERFLPDPFTPAPGTRMYRTGDLARMDSAGVLHFVGRADTQVKIRGYRVEPAEVEIVLAGDPRVREVAVGTRPIAEGVPALVAYLVADGERPSVTELGERVRRALPDYMVPSRFVVLEKLPKTSSGKVDHQALSTVDVPAVPEDPGSRDSLPGLVTAIWQRVLGHDEFEADDDFFDVGGDSMLAAWAMTELGQSLGRELGLSLLLRESTVRGLAGLLASELSERSGPAVVRPRSEIFTLRAGPSNRALFLFHALGGELSCYRRLAREMRAPLRVLGVRWAGDPGGRGLSVPELAAVHVEQIRTVQPDGPYLLAGWSFGGVLAFEVARQLVAEGSGVEFVGMLDANPLRDPITGLVPKDTGYLSLLVRVLDDLERREVTDEEPVDVSEFADDAAWARLMGTTPAGLPVRHVRRYLALARDNMRAAIGYEPRCYPGDVDLFQAAALASEAQRQLAADLRRVVAGKVRITPAPGDHAGMLTGPRAGVLASLVDEALERSRKAGKRS